MTDAAPLAPAEASSSPAAPDETRRPGAAGPEDLRLAVKTLAPQFRIPGASDRKGAWAESASTSPFLAVGDFTNDGLEDYALILLAPAGWKLAAFHRTREGRFSLVTLMEGTGKTVTHGGVEVPYNYILDVHSKGAVWKYPKFDESGEPTGEGEIKYDADAILVESEGSLSFYHWDGLKYGRKRLSAE